MGKVKIVVVGGGVAAKGFLSAALDFYHNLEITVIRKYNKAPVPCGIPYVLGTLDSADKNISPDSNFIEKGVKFIIDEVTDINRDDKEVILKSGGKLPFDKLVLATGTEPLRPPLEGIELDNVVGIYKDVDYVKLFKEKVESAKNIVIVGGGFIGVEIADEISKLKDKNISIIELARNCLWQAFDIEFCEQIEEILSKKGIRLYTQTGVKRFKGKGKVEEVELDNGKVLKADLVFLNIGAKPATELAIKAGLNVTKRKSIVVDKFMHTSQPDILAIGDCTGKTDFFSGQESAIMLASVAAKEGRIAAMNLFGCNFSLGSMGTLSVFTTFVDGAFFGSAGISEEKAQKDGYMYRVINVEAPDRHPGTFSDTKPLKAKFIFAENTGILLGIQLSGGVQMAEIVNLAGFAIQEKNTAYQLFAKIYGTHPRATSSPNHYIIHSAAQKMMKVLGEAAAF